MTSDKTISVLVVDDSAFMRKALTMMLESDPQIKVVGSARDGKEGCEKVKELKPDLVTMDIEMPRMDGLTALRNIMLENPTPVMMLSSLTTDGAGATLDALDLGAVDFIPKELSYVSLDIVKIKEELLRKIKDIARRKHILMARHKQALAFQQAKGDTQKLRTNIEASGAKTKSSPILTSQPTLTKRNHQIDIVGIGSSTGGPPALQAVITKLPRNLPVGIVVAQHMPPMFTISLADRLNTLSELQVKEAEDGEMVEPGVVYIAQGGRHLTLRKIGSQSKIIISDQPESTLYKPCVDVMMNSVIKAYSNSTLGVILTGMGNNGIESFTKLHSLGGKIIAQNEDTCIVYGMPRAVIEAKIADHISPIQNIYSEITAYF